MDLDKNFEKYKKYKIKYINLKNNITTCIFNEKIVKRFVCDNIEPKVKISINNINEKTNQIAFGFVKYGYKNGECYNDNHLENALSVFKKTKNDKCIFNYILEELIKNKRKKIYIIDGMNFLTLFMKYIIENKNNKKLEQLINSMSYGDVKEFHELCKKTSETDIEMILNSDKEIGKNKYSKNLFRINFLKDLFSKFFINNNENIYIILHHGYNYVDSFIRGKMNRGNSENLYRDIFMEENYILVSTYSESLLYPNINTYKGKMNKTMKEIIKYNNNTKDIENLINSEFNEKIEKKQKNKEIMEGFKKKYFNFVHVNNILNTRICKTSNETDDYCILILYYYLKYMMDMENVTIVSNDKFGWNKNDIHNENIMNINDFIKLN